MSAPSAEPFCHTSTSGPAVPSPGGPGPPYDTSQGVPAFGVQGQDTFQCWFLGGGENGEKPVDA